MQFSEIKMAYYYNYIVQFCHVTWHKHAMFYVGFFSYAREITKIAMSCEPEILYTNYTFDCLRYDIRSVSRILP